LGTQDTILVLIYISVNKCMLSYKTLSVSTFMMFKQQSVLYEVCVYAGDACITVDLHESDKRNVLLGPLLIDN
jgi:hypothetical protein